MRASNGLGVLALSLLVAGCGGNLTALPTVTSAPTAAGEPADSSPELSPAEPASPDLLATTIDFYQARYPLKDTHTKLVNYSGNGFENLYGVRNFRAVLNGVAYRGGANNPNNKYGKKSNNNPLPVIGLQNLCEEGFSTAVYLYSTNYNSVPHAVDCISRVTGKPNHLDYKFFNPTSAAGQTAILDAVYRAMTTASVGPVYLHCWNGWHASGLASAIVLRQFCGMSADDAVSYWTLNTDGAPVDSSYSSIKDRIRKFQVRPGYVLPASVRAQVCPQ